MLPSEAAALGMAIEALEKPAALQRQDDGRRRGAEVTNSGGSGSSDPQALKALRPRDIAAEAIGMSEPT